MPTLHWDHRTDAFTSHLKVPYRLLQHRSSHGTALSGGGANAGAENLLIQGDNLEALKALLPFYSGRIKCIFIDPPYNTGSAFTHYDDKLEHSIWLSMMLPRLKLLHQLLAIDGSIWVTIDDNEAHYLKVMMDEVFGRENFVANVVWQKRTSPDNRLRLGSAHDNLLVCGKSPLVQQSFNQLQLSEKRIKEFKNPDNDFRGAWASTDCTAQAGHATANQFYVLTTPIGRVIKLPGDLCWRYTKERMDEEIEAGRIWFGKDGKGVPRKKTYLSEKVGQNSWTWWTNNDVGHNQEAKKEINELFSGDESFATPKPERLIQRILQIATSLDDIVLDSFLGSGTTAAVAHKMGRRWIGIEMGEQAVTHCLPRLAKVIDGEPGGISKAVNWQGGGGFSFYTLGEPIFDALGRINPAIRFADLAAYVWQAETGQLTAPPNAQVPATQASEQATAQATAQTTQPANPTLHIDATPLLGIYQGRAYFLLYNGILKDRRPDAGNVLTPAVWAWLQSLLPAAGQGQGLPCTVFGDSSLILAAQRERLNIEFKRMPYKLKKV